jgi:predicted RNA-binding protein YlqC (UPF0109 family)
MTIPDLIADICRAIAGHGFRLAVAQGEVTLLIEIFGKGAAAGHLIGRQHQMADALREIGRVAGWRQGLNVHLHVEVE